LSRGDGLELGDGDLVAIYKLMLLTRILDSKILSIQRQGKIGPYVPCSGEEAAMVASAYALQRQDWMFTSYRELGSHIARGLPVERVLAQLFGNSFDYSKGRQMSNSWQSKELNTVPTAAPIGAYLPVSVGVALAFKICNENAAILAYFGDGATSSSDFHIAMNFAGVFKAPIVFFCRNNGWAISLPVSKQTAAKTIAQKAQAYGFHGITIDGNDAPSVYSATAQALNRARKGGGPTLIEAVTFRTSPHSTADDPLRYMTRTQLEERRKEDSLLKMKNMLIQRKIWSSQEENAERARIENLVSECVRNQEKIGPLPVPQLLFDDVYSELPWSLVEQKEELGARFLHRNEGNDA
jgi:pyruvate dehydrogenase E1 component alpha subunit